MIRFVLNIKIICVWENITLLTHLQRLKMIVYHQNLLDVILQTVLVLKNIKTNFTLMILNLNNIR